MAGVYTHYVLSYIVLHQITLYYIMHDIILDSVLFPYTILAYATLCLYFLSYLLELGRTQRSFSRLSEPWLAQFSARGRIRGLPHLGSSASKAWPL